eukprot:3199618-Prymnesium_polylepis.1
MVPTRSAVVLSASLLAAGALLLLLRRRRRTDLLPASAGQANAETSLTDAEEALRAGDVRPKVIAVLPTAVEGRPWYPQVVVSDVSAPYARPARERVVGLHLGSEANPPESLVVLRRVARGEWVIVPEALLKRYARYSLLAFVWLPAFEPGSRALLVGLGAGSLVHYWTRCVPGGANLAVDAIELDGAVLDAARAHLAFESCEADGRVQAIVGDGADFVRRADDE